MFNVLIDATPSLTSVTSLATELITWLTSAMGSMMTFIRSTPEIMFFFIVAIVSFGVGMLFRLWHSVG